jgi:CcmD family protein
MRVARIVIVMVALAAPAVVAQDKPSQPPSGFVAVDQVPEGEQIPAINLVAAAYGFVWLALCAYVWSLGRRIRQVESDVASLEGRRPPFPEATGGKR